MKTETKASHTPGPWRVDPLEPRRVLADAINGFDPLTGENVIGGASVHPDAEANARLIAAAPELLDACKEMLSHIEHYFAGDFGQLEGYVDLQAARAAIAKAEGAK